MLTAGKSLQSCPTLCDPIDGSPPGSPVPGILQARTLEWVAISFSNAWKGKVKGKSLSGIWLCDFMDWSLPGSSVHGIFQARVLEWGAIAFSRYQAHYCKKKVSLFNSTDDPSHSWCYPSETLSPLLCSLNRMPEFIFMVLLDSSFLSVTIMNMSSLN